MLTINFSCSIPLAGTIAIAIVNDAILRFEAPPLVSVFNLPASAALANLRIMENDKESAVHVITGDFLKDELPRGVDGKGEYFNFYQSDFLYTISVCVSSSIAVVVSMSLRY